VIALHSSSHPDSARWYANLDPTFSWESSSPGGTFIDGYAWRLDQNSSGDPGPTVTSAALAYAAQRTYPAASGAIALVAADLNGDGRPDLVTANYNAGTISVLMNEGDGSFAATQTYTVGTHPWGLAVADFNGDDHPDIAVTLNGASKVGILLNMGDGSFTAAQTYVAGLNPEGIAAADLNGDGHADLVVVNHGDGVADGTVSVFMNNGGGTFAAQKTYQVGAGPAFVAAGDLNGDGYPDVAVTNFAENTVSVFMNNGGGTFTAQAIYPVGSGPACVAIADLNGDGRPDLAVANHDGNTAGVLLNNGGGTFGLQQTYAAGQGPQGIAVADLNGDGHPDLVVTDRGAPTLNVLLGNGDGSFATRQTFAVGSSSWRVVAGDLNGDGHLDLAVANAGDGTVSVLLDQAGMASLVAGSDGTWYFHVSAHDAAGSWGDTSSVQVNIDTTPPVTTDNANPGGLPTWHAGPWTMTLTPTDPPAGDGSHSGMVGGQATTQYSLDGGATWQSGTAVAFPRWKRGGGSGTYTVLYRSTDAAGNTEQNEPTTVRIDNSLPTSSAALTTSGDPATVTVTAADSGSGVNCIWYSLDGGAWTQVSYPSSGGVAVSVSGSGDHTLCYYAVDNAGNPQAGYNVAMVTVSAGTTLKARLAGVHRHPLERRRS
jgi:hypothetical protein